MDLVSESRVDGIVVFTWSDLLEDALIRKDSRRTEALRSAINQKQVRDA